MSKISKKAEVIAKKTAKKEKVVKLEKAKVAKRRNSLQLLKDSVIIQVKNHRLIGGISIVYAILLYIFVFSDAGLDIANAKNYISETLGGESNNLSSSVTIFGYLLDNTAISKNPVLPLYQTVFGIIASLAYIWAQREIFIGKSSARIRDAFYTSTDQLIPFLIILVIITLQFIPAAIGSSIYNSTILQGYVTNPLEIAVIVAIILTFVFVSLLLVVPSIPAIYIVTLRGSTPLESYKAARKLVKGQRFTIMRKLIILTVVLLGVSALVVVPLIAFLPALAEFTFLIFSVLAMAFIHTYLYQLYRDLI